MELTNDRESRLLDAQAALIGSLLIKPEIAAEMFAAVLSEEFTIPQYRRLYDLCRELHRNGNAPDAILLAGKAGKEYQKLIMDCLTVTPSAASWKAYARRLREDSTLQRLREYGMQIAMAEDANAAVETLRQAEKLFDRRAESRTVTLVDGLNALIQRQREHEEPKYLKTGFKELDSRTFADLGDYIIIGGYPSSGKTALSLQMALTLSATHRVGFFTLETSTDKLMDRAAACYASINFSGIKKRELNEGSIKRLEQLRDMVKDRYQLCFEPASRMTVQELESVTLARGYEIIIIDYVQLLTAGGREKTRFESTTEVSMELHRFAQDRHVCVIALSQLSRPEKGRKTNRPTMSDLRESGQLEQDADIIMLLSTDSFEANSPERVLTVAKNKEGQRGVLYLRFIGEQQRFYSNGVKREPQEDQKDDQAG